MAKITNLSKFRVLKKDPSEYLGVKGRNQWHRPQHGLTEESAMHNKHSEHDDHYSNIKGDPTRKYKSAISRQSTHKGIDKK